MTSHEREAILDAIYQLLHTARHDIDGCLASLHNSDVVGLKHHVAHMTDALRIVVSQLKELSAKSTNPPSG